MPTRRCIATLAALLAAGSILVMGPAVPAATAHAGVVATSPKRGARLDKAPTAVTVTFTEEFVEGTIAARKSGVLVSKGIGGKDPRNVRRLRVALKPRIGTGTFVVSWTITAADGHHQHGSFSFRVT
jgi:methionine-rich copper-binding protein CopC